MVYAVRLQCGRQLAIEHPVEADIVSSVPESGTAAAHGFSRQVGGNFWKVLLIVIFFLFEQFQIKKALNISTKHTKQCYVGVMYLKKTSINHNLLLLIMQKYETSISFYSREYHLPKYFAKTDT